MGTPTKPDVMARAADLMLDGAALTGAALIVHGVDLVFRPAAFVVAGLFIFGGAWLAARKAG